MLPSPPVRRHSPFAVALCCCPATPAASAAIRPRTPSAAGFHPNTFRAIDTFSLLIARSRLAQVVLRLRLALQRRNLVGIDPNHEIGDVVVDLGEPVARS